MTLPRRYRALLWPVTLLAAAPAVHAQMHHVDAPERVTRAIGVYEWTGELGKPTAARFVPVSLFIDGHFEDAGLYLARPVPFALQTGDVYSLERAGAPAGLLDLDFARRVVTGNALADDNTEGAWYGFGKFTLEAPPKVTALHKSSHLTAIQSSAGPNTAAGSKLPAAEPDGDKPHLSRRGSGTPAPTDSTPRTDSGSPAPAGSGQSGSSSSPADQNKSTDANSGTATPTSSTSTAPTGNSSDDDLDRPTLRKRDPSQDAKRRREYGSGGKTSGVTAAGPALGDDPDRPTLTRGSAEEAGTPELTGLPPDLHQAVAVSDAAHREAHLFARDWDSPAERSETLAAMAALAKPAITAYLAVNRLVPSAAPIAPLPPNAVPTPTRDAALASGGTTAPGGATAPVPASATDATSDTSAPPKLQRGIPQQYQKPTPSPAASKPAVSTPTASASATVPTSGSATTPSQPAPGASPTQTVAGKPTATAARRSTHPLAKTVAARPVPLTLRQEELSGFSLSYGGLPTFVYTAAVATAPVGRAPAGLAKPNPVAFVTVVAQRLPSGELQVALNNVTDSQHLDRGPRLRLVDAVDPDDSHRASLLFELRGSNSRQFALYRLTAVHAEQTFTTASIE